MVVLSTSDGRRRLWKELMGAPWSLFCKRNSCRFRVEAVHKFSIEKIVEGGLYGSLRKYVCIMY